MGKVHYKKILRYLKLGGAVDQTLFNIVVPDNRKDYFPFTLGAYSLVCNDEEFDQMKIRDHGLKEWLASPLNNIKDNPKKLEEYHSIIYDAPFIHQFLCKCKWCYGKGLSFHRHLVKYFIEKAGIWEELCKKRSGYCM